jgi:hypothetical protein
MATSWILMAILLPAAPGDGSRPMVSEQPAARVAQAPRARNAQRGAAPAVRGRRGANAARPAARGAARPANPNTTDQNAQELIDVIQETVAPNSWEPRGGPGRIRYFAPRQVLVIRQSSEAHEELQGLLRQLRR